MSFVSASDVAEIVASRFNQGRLSLASVDDMHNASACADFPFISATWFKMNRFWARQNCGDDLCDCEQIFYLFVRTFRNITTYPEFRKKASGPISRLNLQINLDRHSSSIIRPTFISTQPLVKFANTFVFE